MVFFLFSDTFYTNPAPIDHPGTPHGYPGLSCRDRTGQIMRLFKTNQLAFGAKHQLIVLNLIVYNLIGSDVFVKSHGVGVIPPCIPHDYILYNAME